MYALFEGNKQISKAHASERAAVVEAFERKLVVDGAADFPGDKSGRFLIPPYEIREV